MEIKEMSITKKEVIKYVEQVRKSEKENNIYGYQVFNPETKKFLKINARPHKQAIEFTSNSNEAFIFKNRILLLIALAEINTDLEIIPLKKIE